MTTFSAGRDQFDPGLVVVAPDVFGIGGVEHQQHMRRAGRRAAASPRRTADRCRSDCSGLARKTIRVAAVTAARMASTSAVRSRLGRDDRLGAGRQGRDRIHQEAVGAVDRLVARAEIGARQQVDQVVGAGAADDAVGVEPEARRRSPRAARVGARRRDSPAAGRRPPR